MDPRLWSEFEYALWQLGSAFARWRRDCFAAVSDVGLSGTEASILHVVHINGTPKGLMEISRLLHRDDLPNLQYAIKKLIKVGLIRKTGTSRKTMMYEVSQEGARIVAAFQQKRSETLMKMLGHVSGLPEDLEEMITRLHLLTGIYDQSSDLVRSHQP
ncbi:MULTISPECIES: winged helix DNA-binding protein [unclassified Roseitalea]|uniref:winged helix DNA-binding protein n=1 Tax=unclassified Roseitalea TaxID=2639107 RepID=UPI00273D1686|nr:MULTISPECIES: winged helix DNA-binding protein [unclassified Roseitalea]